MASKVFDNAALPNVKSDFPGNSLAAKGIPSDQGWDYTDANNTRTWFNDLRDGILAGLWNRLVSNPTAPVGTGNDVVQRSNAGVHEVSENGEAFWPRSGKLAAGGTVTTTYTGALDGTGATSITLGGNITVANPTGSYAAKAARGEHVFLTYVFTQDATGGRSVSWGAVFQGTTWFQPRQGATQKSSATFLAQADGTLKLVGFDGIDIRHIKFSDFGGDPTASGATNTAAWKAAQAYLVAKGGGKLEFGPGTHNFSEPPTVNQSSVHLEGVSRFGTTLNFTGLGPALAFNPPTRNITTVAATSTGVGMQLSSTLNSPSLNLDDLQDSNGKRVNLNGLTAATMEYEHDVSASFSGDVVAFSCGSSYADIGAATFSWKIHLLDALSNGDGSNDGFYVYGGINIAGSFTYALSTKLAYGKYHLALTYDNSHIRVWANGVKIAEQAATGAIVQSKFHATTLGQGVLLYPEYHGGSYNPGAGVARIPRISKSCRYTGTFTAPATTWGTADANTLWQTNFDNLQDSYVVGQSTSGQAAWTLVRGGPTAYVSGCSIEKLTVTGGSGIILEAFVDGLVSSVRSGQGGGRGITVLGSLSYKSRYEHCLLYGSDYPFATGGNAVVELTGVALDGGAACGHFADAGITITHLDVAPEAGTVYGLLWREPYACVATNVFFDVETAVGGTYLQNMVISGMTDAHSLTFVGGSFEPTSVAVPAARLSGVTSGLKFVNAQFGNNGGHVFSASAGTDRVTVDDSCVLPSAHDWCSTAGVVQTQYRGSKTWDPASVADGANTSTTVTVTGAALGDYAKPSFTIAVPAGAKLEAAVTAADTVTVTLFNNTGGALDLASGTLRVRVDTGNS